MQVFDRITIKPSESFDPKGWAHRIIARHKAGEKINRTALKMARQALGLEA